MLDMTVAVTTLIISVPSTIAAVAALSNGRTARKLHDEMVSPNGTTTGQSVEDIKSAVFAVRANQSVHELADVERFRKVHARLDTVDAVHARIASHEELPPQS